MAYASPTVSIKSVVSACYLIRVLIMMMIRQMYWLIYTVMGRQVSEVCCSLILSRTEIN